MGNMEEESYFGDSKLLELKKYLCSKFEDELNELEYLDNNKITEILLEGLQKHFGITWVKPNDKTYNRLWHIFVTPNYDAFIQMGKKDTSGIYEFNPKQVEINFEKYQGRLTELLRMQKN